MDFSFLRGKCSMYKNFFTDYLDQLQKCNQKWWEEIENNKTTFNSPLGKAINEVNLDDITKLLEKAVSNPDALMKIQMNWWENQFKIWQSISQPTQAQKEHDLIEPDKGDKRFNHPAWKEESMFNFIKQSYLLFSNTVQQTIDSVDGIEPEVKERLSFFSRQAVNAMSPSNFISTNPELMKLTIESNGQNLVKGIKLLKEDLDASAEMLKVRMTNSAAFELGKNIANTAGDVIYRNDLFELIEYKPTTEKVNKTPLLFIPPFINKYYILDLREKNSMIKWLVEQGHRVFLMSWKNPNSEMAKVGFEDYVVDGALNAINIVSDVTKQKEINVSGYCIGGTLLATTLAYLKATGQKSKVKTATFFTTLLDFSQPGELGSFINDQVITAIEEQNTSKGYLDGRSLSVTFSLLRENSLYWNYYIDNYLKGNSPVDFDMLYWNSDSTNVSAKCHNNILRDFYLDNSLANGKFKVKGVEIDLSAVDTNSYFISTKEDHIALWQATYRGALMFKGDKTFVLGDSGHIAGIVNHQSKNKYSYYTNTHLVESPEDWKNDMKVNEGSWWTHWNEWLSKNSPSTKVLAPKNAGNDEFKSINVAPGDYVKETLS